jgi:hypothetical protein
VRGGGWLGAAQAAGGLAAALAASGLVALAAGGLVALAAGGLAALAAPAAAEPLVERVSSSLLVDVETAVQTRDAHFQKAEVVALPRLDLELAGGVSATAIARLRADAFDRLDPGQPRQDEAAPLTRRRFAGDHVDWELRELYLRAPLGRAWLTAGKQQVVWGQADGLKVLDLVDPQSFREFILDDFEDSRIPLWTLNLEIPVGPGELQLLWLPDPSHHELPPPDGVFAFRSPRLLPPQVPGFAPVVLPVDRPGNALLDSDAGARLRGFVGGFDLSLNYLYQYADRPVFEGRLGSGPLGPTATYTPTYERTHIVGGTFSNAWGDFTLRGELALSTNRFVSTTDPMQARLLHETPELGYVLGLDWFGLSETFVSVQLFQSWLLDDARGLVRDALDTNVTVYVERRLWNDRLRLETMWIHNVNDGDGLVRPKASYELRTGLVGWLGLDLFYGSERGLFGQYQARDRLVVGLELGL